MDKIKLSCTPEDKDGGYYKIEKDIDQDANSTEFAEHLVGMLDSFMLLAGYQPKCIAESLHPQEVSCTCGTFTRLLTDGTLQHDSSAREYYIDIGGSPEENRVIFDYCPCCGGAFKSGENGWR